MTIPTCHSCGSGALPFAVRIDAGRWKHSCGAVVCPACGGVPQEGDHLCAVCRQLVGAPRPGAVEMEAADVVRGGARAAASRGRVRRGRR